MINFFKAEWFRHSKITGYRIFLLLLILLILGVNLFLKIISPLQNFKITMAEGVKIFSGLYLMGLTLVFPIMAGAYINKSKFMQEQLLSSGVGDIKIYLTDIVMGVIISTITFIILQLFSLLFGYIILGASESALNFGKANYNVGLVSLAVILTNISLSIQAISIQKICRNPIVSTGLFVLISYILGIIFMQLRLFSNIAEKLSLLFPICDLNYFVAGYITPFRFVIFNMIIIVASVFAVITSSVINKRRV